MAIWLLKSDPETYSFDDLQKDGKTDWDGVRNYQARNYIKEMLAGDDLLIYHSQSDKSIVGTAVVSKEYFPDKTTDDDRWFAVEIEYKSKFETPVSLEVIKSNKILSDLPLVKQQRLSVMPVSNKQYEEIIKLSQM